MSFLDPLLGKKKSFFNQDDEERMVKAIRSAEQQTSGEIRIFLERHCRFIDPLDRAKEIFLELNMHQTRDRNGVLLYIATEDHQLALLGDEGIHQRLGQSFWENEIRTILSDFKHHHFIDGVCHIIGDVGQALKHHFPFENGDINELDDTIVYGK